VERNPDLVELSVWNEPNWQSMLDTIPCELIASWCTVCIVLDINGHPVELSQSTLVCHQRRNGA